MAGIEDVQRAINAEMAQAGYTRSQMAAAIGIDPGTLGDLLDGRRTPKAPTQGKVERYFRWPAGTIAEVLASRGHLPASKTVTAAQVLQGLIDEPSDPVEAQALVSVLERQLEEALAEWAEAQAEIARIHMDIAAVTERRASLAAEIARLRTQHPEINAVVPIGGRRREGAAGHEPEMPASAAARQGDRDPDEP